MRLFLDRYKTFWRTRDQYSKVIFHISRILFSKGDLYHKVKEAISITKQLWVAILAYCLLAPLLLILLEIADYALVKTEYLREIPYLRTLILTIETFHNLLRSHPVPLDSFLVTIVSISGLFLGLYFTAISVVVSSVFSRITPNIRNLILHEKVGDRYIDILSLLISSCIWILGCRAFGYCPGVLVWVFVLLASCYGVFCFVKLGKRIFSFFDITALRGTVFYELLRYVRLATVDGYRFRDRNFQAHYQKLAAGSINQLASLVNVAQKDKHLKAGSLSSVLSEIVISLSSYVGRKRCIPTDSYWYPRIHKHKDWFLTDYSSLELALTTGTQIRPDEVPDRYWLETRAYGIILDTIDSLLKSGQKQDLEVVYAIMNTAWDYFETLGKEMEVVAGIEFLSKIGERFSRNLSAKDEKNINLKLALVEIWCLSLISLALGFINMIPRVTTKYIHQAIDGFKWDNEKYIYAKRVPFRLLESFEGLKEKLLFEKSVSGKIITPAWYIKEIIAVEYSEILSECIQKLLLKSQEVFLDTSDRYIKDGETLFAACVASRGLEIGNKLNAHYGTLKEVITGLNEFSIQESINWPEWDWDTIENGIREINTGSKTTLAKCLPGLSILEKGDKLPDFFGQAYNNVSQACYDSLAQNDSKTFSECFGLLLFGSIQAHHKIRNKLIELKRTHVLELCFEPFLDLIDLSGYAIIYSEFHANPKLWMECKKVWDGYFKSLDNQTGAAKYIFGIFEIKQLPSFSISSPDLLRTRWQMVMNSKFREAGLIDDMFGGGRLFGSSPTVRHESPLIRVLCRGRYEPMETAGEIFMVQYFIRHEAAKGLEFTDRQGFIERIEKESKSANGKEKDDAE